MSKMGVYWNEKAEFYSEVNAHSKMTEGINCKTMGYLLMVSFSAMVNVREPGKQFKDP
jgi:hypothetical protein